MHKLIGGAVAASFLVSAGIAAAQTTDGVFVSIDTAPSVPAGAQGVALANISLDATAASGVVSITNVPLTVSSGGGASAADLTNCHIENAVQNIAISDSYSLTDGAQTSFALTGAYPAVGGIASMLSLVCNVAPATPVGGTFTISVAPQDINATGLNGDAVDLEAATSTGANGIPASTSGEVMVSAATGTGGAGGGGSATPGIPSTGGIPGIPNTGAGGAAAGMLLLLAAAGGVALAGARYLRMQRQ